MKQGTEVAQSLVLCDETESVVREGELTIC